MLFDENHLMESLSGLFGNGCMGIEDSYGDRIFCPKPSEKGKANGRRPKIPNKNVTWQICKNTNILFCFLEV